MSNLEEHEREQAEISAEWDAREMTRDARRIAAIRARVNGVWDDPDLRAFGPMPASLVESILLILDANP